MEEKKLVIVGSGPAGYTAAIYAARAELKPVLFEGFFSGPSGGQLVTTTEVENFPGFPEGIMGPDLMVAMRTQARRFGTHTLMEDVVSVDLSQRPFLVKGSKNHFLTQALIIATGASAKRLDVPGARDGELWQKGVTACAVCDGAMPIFRNKDLYVVGGGDTAVEEALFLTKFGSRVFIVHRREQLRASLIMAKRAADHPKVTLLWNKELRSVGGNEVVEFVTLFDNKTQKEETYPAGGLFFAIGHTPNTSFLKGIDLDDHGYIKVKPGTTLTNVEGVFACGDVQDKVYRQAVTAAGTGCMAALEAEKWLQARGD